MKTREEAARKWWITQGYSFIADDELRTHGWDCAKLGFLAGIEWLESQASERQYNREWFEEAQKEIAEKDARIEFLSASHFDLDVKLQEAKATCFVLSRQIAEEDKQLQLLLKLANWDNATREEIDALIVLHKKYYPENY